MPEQQQATRPYMTTIGGRPAKVLPQLASLHGVSVWCRLADGTDVWVPLSEICRLFVEEVAHQTKVQEGLSNA
jgi:hypothetical protein